MSSWQLSLSCGFACLRIACLKDGTAGARWLPNCCRHGNAVQTDVHSEAASVGSSSCQQSLWQQLCCKTICGAALHSLCAKYHCACSASTSCTMLVAAKYSAAAAAPRRLCIAPASLTSVALVQCGAAPHCIQPAAADCNRMCQAARYGCSFTLCVLQLSYGALLFTQMSPVSCHLLIHRSCKAMAMSTCL